VLPADHWRLALARARLSACTQSADQLDESRAMLQSSHAKIEAALGPTSFHARETLCYQIMLDELAQDVEAARADRLLLAAALQGSENWNDVEAERAAFGPEHSDVHAALGNLKHSSTQIEKSVQEFLQTRQRLLADDHPLGAVIADRLANWVNQHINSPGGQFNDATFALLQEAARLARASTIMGPRKRSSVYWWLGNNLVARGAYEQAEPLLRECLAIQENQTSEHDRDYFASHSRWLLGRCLYKQQRYDEAEALLVAAYEKLLESHTISDANTRIALSCLIELYRDQNKPREALAMIHKAARLKLFPPWDWDPWKLTRFIFEAADADLANAVERLREGCTGDAASVTALVEHALAERRRVLVDDDPLTLLFTGYVWKCTDPSLYSGVPAWIWEPFAQDALRVFRAQAVAGHSQDVHATTLLAKTVESRGDFAHAERLAEQALDGYRRLVPDTHQGIMYICAIKAKALLGLGRAEEAQQLLVPGYRFALSGYGLAHAYNSYVLGAVADLCSVTRQPRLASEILIPLLQELGASSRDAQVLARMARAVVRCPGLDQELYAAALALAEAACKRKPDNPDLLTILGAALYRADRNEEAAATLTRAIELGGRFPVQQDAFLAMALQRLGRAHEARAAFDRLTQQMQDPLHDAGDRDNQLLWNEVAADLQQ
jgi:tetratricopeptide (TPR) repeat protein